MIILLGMMIESNDHKTKMVMTMMKLKGGKDWMVMTRGRQCNLTHRSNQNTIDRCDNNDDDDDAAAAADDDDADDNDDHHFKLLFCISLCVRVFVTSLKNKFLNQIL